MTTLDLTRPDAPPLATDDAGLDPRRASLLAGLAYAGIFVLAFFANFVVRENMVDLDDAGATVAEISSSEGLFRLAMFAFVIVFALDVVVSWLLHVVLRAHGESRSLLTAWLRLSYTIFLGVAVVFMFVALRLVDGSGFAGAIEGESRDALALLAVDAFNATWMIGLVLFGLHLLMIGRILWDARIAPRWIPVALGAAGLAYLIDSVGYTLLSDYDANAGIFTAIVVGPAVLAEGSLTYWLLRNGRRERTALTPA